MDANQKRMVAQIANPKDWVGKPLTEFAIRKMIEVFGCNEDGNRTKSIGYFKNPTVAAAFAGQESGKTFISCRTRECYVLTNGAIGFLLAENEPVNLYNDETEALRIREEILSKLDPKDRAILGL